MHAARPRSGCQRGSGEGSPPGCRRVTCPCTLTWQREGKGSLWGLLEGHEPHSRGIHPHDLITSPKPHLKPSRWAFEFHNIQIWQGLQTLSLYHYQAIPFLRSFKLEKLIYGWGEKTTAVLASVGTECGCEKAQEKRVEGRNVLCLHLPKPADSDT